MVIMKLLPFQQVKIFGRLVVADKEYARNLLEISMNHLQSRSFRLRVSLKKIMQCATIPSLTVGKIKNGYKPSKHGLCSRFLFRNDMCYIMIFLI